MAVEKLYSLCEVIDEAVKADDKDTVRTQYLTILECTKVNDKNTKRLTAQFIPRYFHKNEDLQQQSLDAIFTLCEDQDVDIRKDAVRALALLCKPSAGPPGSHVAKVADVLVQLLQAEDSVENTLVQNSLSNVLSAYPKDTIATLFSHIISADEDLLRERAVKFLAMKVQSMLRPGGVLASNEELQKYMVDQSKQALSEVSGDDFILLVGILSQLPAMQSIQGRKMLLELVHEQAELDKPFEAADPDRVDQIVQCSKIAHQFLSRNVSSTPLVSFLLCQAVPKLKQIAANDQRLDVIRQLAELAPHCSAGAIEPASLDGLLERLMDCLPLPPSESGDMSTEAENAAEEPKVAFSDIECLLSTLHSLGKKHPDFLIAEEKAETLKEFRKRLQYLARLIQLYSKKLRGVLTGKPKAELLLEENRLKVVALKTTMNIMDLVRDLLHIPPSYKATVSFSWSPAKTAQADKVEPPVKTPEKRPRIQPPSAGAMRNGAGRQQGAPVQKRARPSQQQYKPPSGKYSSKLGNAP